MKQVRPATFRIGHSQILTTVCPHCREIHELQGNWLKYDEQSKRFRLPETLKFYCHEMQREYLARLDKLKDSHIRK